MHHDGPFDEGAARCGAVNVHRAWVQAQCLAGWATVAFPGQTPLHYVPGDGLCICAGLQHDVPDFSSDYAVLEMCVPADYDTFATKPPQAILE